MRTTDHWLDSIWPLYPPLAVKGVVAQRGHKRDRGRGEARRSVRRGDPLEHDNRPAIVDITRVVKK